MSPGPLARRAAPGAQALCLAAAAVLGLSGGLERAADWGALGRIQAQSSTYLDVSQRKAVEAFAAGRAINAAASILKSAELTPFVVKVAPLELLEPIDDLAKQFSDVMAVSLVAILLQRLLLAVAQTWAFGVALPVGCALWLIAILTTRWPGLALRLAALGRTIVTLAIFARCVVPLAGWAGDSLTQHFLAGDLTKAVATMDAARGNLERFTSTSLALKASDPAASLPAPGQGNVPPPTWADWLSRMFSAASQDATSAAGGMVDAVRSWVPDGAAIAAIVSALADVPNQIVTAIEIFLVQTILAPGVVAILFYAALRTITRPAR